ncbi:MAG: SAM-dependent methyltransferase [Euryarchaeota archaeon]|nr:SAM-dependent methyltransferase [Euryarchaeota archaeon]
MTVPLLERIRTEIREEGPMRFDRFMALALYDEAEGYYGGGAGTRAGTEGDFVTAPTLTPWFGATVARFASAVWERLGKPDAWHIVEAAAGTGALAIPLLERLREEAPAAYGALRYTLVDVDPAHRDAARRGLQTHIEAGHVEVVETLPKSVGPTLVLANELLDNLPVRLLRRRAEAWWERLVALDDSKEQDVRFVWHEAPAPQDLIDQVESFGIPVPDGQLVEVPVGAEAWLQEITDKTEPPTFLLLVDYGEVARDLLGEPRPEGTLRTYSGHRKDLPVLEYPGSRDITTHVSWTAAARAAERLGWKVHGFATQSAFLRDLGLLQTAAGLAATVQDEAGMASLAALKEILLPGGMGEDVKVLCLERAVPQDGRLPGFSNVRPVDPRPRGD